MKDWGEKLFLGLGWVAISPFLLFELIVRGFKWVVHLKFRLSFLPTTESTFSLNVFSSYPVNPAGRTVSKCSSVMTDPPMELKSC